MAAPSSSCVLAPFHRRLLYRFTEKGSDDGVAGMFLTVCAFACAAECVNTVITPSFTYRDAEATGTFCNLFGAFMAGLALAAGGVGPRCEAFSEAFRGGFVAAFTSFCHVVEHSSSLQCDGIENSAPTVYMATAIIGGPLFFGLGSSFGNLCTRLLQPAPAASAAAALSFDKLGHPLSSGLEERLLPREWTPRVNNLLARFPRASRDQVIAAVMTAGGHGGKAAALLDANRIDRAGVWLDDNVAKAGKCEEGEDSQASQEAEDIAAAGSALLHLRCFLCVAITVAIAVQAQRTGMEGTVELLVGVLVTAAACKAGEWAVLFGEEVLITVAGHGHAIQASSVNWGTIIANAAALGLLVHSQLLEALWFRLLGPRPLVDPEIAWFASVVTAKFRTSFCGALSAYGGYSEDVAVSLAGGNIDAAAANMGMHAMTALVFAAVLSHSACAFDTPEWSSVFSRAATQEFTITVPPAA
eukprot:TRINITY_DN58592_c0_g1_i1.p1 TRINITY_DN58592_c0_g1~~TRINITY_DN58592_c0_g1_i1.p1  ORF type:complete len:471 (+),score=101.12 TRINITY_DN58592_c0_g1_i1:58-1470(+)